MRSFIPSNSCLVEGESTAENECQGYIAKNRKGKAKVQKSMHWLRAQPMESWITLANIQRNVTHDLTETRVRTTIKK
jgi:hypothetical protein